ncbi:hypothetical protein Tco_0611359 [Tanacetum coccineum]
MIRFFITSRQSARLTPPAPMHNTQKKTDEMILQDMIQPEGDEKLVEESKNVYGASWKEVHAQVRDQDPVLSCKRVDNEKVIFFMFLHAQVYSSFVPQNNKFNYYLAMKADPYVYNNKTSNLVWYLQMKFDEETDVRFQLSKYQKTHGRDIFDDDEAKLKKQWRNECIRQKILNPHAKIFYIRRQKVLVVNKEEIYSNFKIVQVIKTFWELGHEHKFITEIVARRANGCIVSITEPDYKNLNKNDIEGMYLLIMNNKVPDYANTGLLWSLSVFIRRIEEYDVFSIVYELVHGIIYTNSKKEKRVMRPSEIHKFCDATLRRTLEGLKSYYNDVKYGYVKKELTNDEVEFLKLFEEEIEVRLNY